MYDYGRLDHTTSGGRQKDIAATGRRCFNKLQQGLINSDRYRLQSSVGRLPAGAASGRQRREAIALRQHGIEASDVIHFQD